MEGKEKQCKRKKQCTSQVRLEDLITHLREGQYVIPSFQREFEWKAKHIDDLMRSIFRNYYIGNLLLWKEKDNNLKNLNCDAIRGAEKIQHPASIVLDGQQRLSAMYYAFFAPNIPPPKMKKRTLFFIRVDHFMEEAYEDAFDHSSNAQIWRLFEDREKQFETHKFPLALIGESILEIPDWIRGYEEYWKKKGQEAKIAGEIDDYQTAKQNAQNILKFGDHLQKIIRNYLIVRVELDPDMELGKVCETFTKINSKGVKLDIFDLINALLKPKDLELKNMWRQERKKFEFIGTDRMNIYVLQVMSILKQNYFSPNHLYNLLPGNKRKVRKSEGSYSTEIIVESKEDFEQLWEQAIDELNRAIDLLRHPKEYGVVLSGYLPYTSALPVFAALQATANGLEPNQRFSAQCKIKQWYWVSVFANRYSSSLESTSAKDYQDLKEWFKDNVAKPSWVTEFENRSDKVEMRDSKPTGSIYKGVFNLLILEGALDWITGKAPPLDGTLDNHHIVPKSWGKKNNPKTSIDTILNRTPLSIETNRDVIGADLPNKYLPELIEKRGKAEVRATLRTHLISDKAFDILMREDFTKDDYEDFIEERESNSLESNKR